MTTKQIADRLVELCRKGQIMEAQEELFADNVLSAEPDHSMLKSAKGKDAVAEKGKNFASMIEERHGGSFSDPIIGGKYFSIAMVLDATIKGQGRMVMEEICLYEVKDGKIVLEQFYF
ncbi:MAG: nuclear transport factor 2 family protein [Fimbriimonadaceae bacterium]|nr:nuclear transport factor 2 family protein [Chitinophagales bacterium]